MSDEKLTSLIRSYLSADNEIKHKTIEAEKIKDQIKKEMNDRQVSVVKCGSHIVRYRDVLTSVFDKKAFKEKYDVLYRAFLIQTPSKKFTIS